MDELLSGEGAKRYFGTVIKNHPGRAQDVIATSLHR